MTDQLRTAAQQALEFIRVMNNHGWMLADYEDDSKRVVKDLEDALAEPVQEPDTNSVHESIRWQLCLLAQTEEFSDEVRKQIGRGAWLIDRLRAALAEPVQGPVQEPVTRLFGTLPVYDTASPQRPAEPVQEPVALKWLPAPRKTEWGFGMVSADVEIDRDHTLTLYCEDDQTAKVDAMFRRVFCKEEA